jgi:hypothetical protein
VQGKIFQLHSHQDGLFSSNPSPFVEPPVFFLGISISG